MLRSGWVQDDTKRQTYYDFIFSESERLSRLVANVLHLARLANHDTALALQPHTPAALLDLARAKVYSQVEAAGFTLDVVNRLSEAENHTYLIEAEEDAFTRIVINLVDNALKFAAHAAEKVVRLELRALSGSKPVVIFAVRDYGPGVERDQMKKIFQLFYRPGSELTRTTPGTGIGLALVQELAATMDAEVDLSRQRPGAEFQIKFRVRTSETRHAAERLGAFPGRVLASWRRWRPRPSAAADRPGALETCCGSTTGSRPVSSGSMPTR